MSKSKSEVENIPKNFSKISSISSIIEQCRSRANKLRRNANITIVLIGILLISGIFGFFFASELASYQSNEDILNSYLEQSSKSMLASQTNLASLDLMGEGERGNLSDNGAKMLSQSAESLAVTANILKTLQENPPNRQQQLYYLISIVTTKVGIIVLLLFLVQILVPLYRYFTRLSFFYDSRADILELVGETSEFDLEKLLSIFSPETINFGKEPVPITQHAVEAVKNIISSQK